MKLKCSPWISAITFVILGIGLASCLNNSPLVPAAEYSTKIVGRWCGTVGDLKEALSFAGDGTFSGQVRPTGFIANTLSQSAPSMISGTWKIDGATMTLRITAAQDKRLGKRIVSSTIVSLKANELIIKSDRGDTARFQRVISVI